MHDLRDIPESMEDPFPNTFHVQSDYDLKRNCDQVLAKNERLLFASNFGCTCQIPQRDPSSLMTLKWLCRTCFL